MAALIVSTMSGGSVLTADDSTFETVVDLRQAIQDRHAVRRYQQRLLLGERTLEDDVPLAALGAPAKEEEATPPGDVINTRLRGKRKKMSKPHGRQWRQLACPRILSNG